MIFKVIDKIKIKALHYVVLATASPHDVFLPQLGVYKQSKS